MEQQLLTKDNIRGNLGKLNKDERLIAHDLLRKAGIDLSCIDPEMTHTKVSGFVFQGILYRAETHREVMLKLAENILYNHSKEHDKILGIRGRERVYFSRNRAELSHDYKRINGTDIFAELNENAMTLKKRCEQILLIYGYDLESFHIETY